jgi:hypothetical protein
MRAILDVHPKVKCGNEILTIAHFMRFLENFKIPWTDADITANMIDKASADFISSILTNRNFTAERLCKLIYLVVFFC